ncbi:alpha-2-macroglobulin-like [Gastrophryne carolinensis]
MAAARQYMLLVPSVLKAGNVQTFCIKISHLNESLMVTVDLEANKNMTLLERQVTQREEFNCYAFQVPDEKDSAHVAFINFEAVGDSIHFRTRRSVVIRPLYNLVFLQTDKPIYKPGQKVQFRAVSLDENFRPVQETFPVIYVQDPEGNRISQWLNVETKRGITQESFLLTSEPRQGMYTLVAQRKKGSRVEHTFTVEEYVLPKYEVQVKMPPVITIQDEAVNVSVCGKYTYGRPVAGNIQVRVCRRFSYSYSNCPEDESSVCESLSHEADNQGCFSATVNTKIFQLRRNGYEMKLTALATIKEEGTAIINITIINIAIINITIINITTINITIINITIINITIINITIINITTINITFINITIINITTINITTINITIINIAIINITFINIAIINTTFINIAIINITFINIAIINTTFINIAIINIAIINITTINIAIINITFINIAIINTTFINIAIINIAIINITTINTTTMNTTIINITIINITIINITTINTTINNTAFINITFINIAIINITFINTAIINITISNITIINTTIINITTINIAIINITTINTTINNTTTINITFINIAIINIAIINITVINITIINITIINTTFINITIINIAIINIAIINITIINTTFINITIINIAIINITIINTTIINTTIINTTFINITIINITVINITFNVELTGEGSTQIKTTIARASFRHLDSQFKRGIPLHGQIFLEDAAGKPIPNEIVTLYIGYDGKNYTTGSDGTADFTICTSSLNESSILLRASYKTRQHCYSQRSVFPTYEEDSRTVSRYYSRSNSFLKIQPIYQPLECQTEMSMTVHYKLSAEGVKDMSHAVFHYLIMSKAAIKRYGTQKIYMDGQESDGQFTFNFYTGFNLSPLANVLVYMVLDSGEVIADSAKFKVKNCFANEAKVTFTDNEVLPGSNVDLVLTSHPNSMCALRAVDKSVLLLKPEAELSAKTVYDLLPLTDLSGYMHEGFFLEEMREDPCIKLDPIFMNGVYYVPSAPKWDSDVYSILKIFGSWNITAHVSTGQPIVVLDSQLGNKIKAFGLKVGTNTNIRVPRLCAGSHPVHFAPGVSGAGRFATDYIEPIAMMSSMEVDRAVSSVQEAIIETARTFFPETWLWDLVVIDAPGESVMKLTVPDSITTWKVGMFCTSEEVGFGLAETVSLLTFQHFFLDLTLPYSAVRGEEFTLKATVFNYMKQSIRMKVTLEDSDQFTVKKRSVEHDTYCVEANGRVTVTWEVVLKSLYKVNFTVSAETVSDGDPCGNEIVSPAQGRKDIITKHIIVHPEGIPKEETHTAMICNKDSTTTETIALVLPSLTVEGSARAVFSVIGDIMGTAMQNLGNLLKMPYGCGEQNMGLFTPNILILDYLNNTKQLTPEIQSKALNFLSTGYQRQLNYKHSDGSYSAFGPHYGQGNTWLTAFVLRSFYRAKSHIYIDPRQISDPLTWLSLRQKENGCFQSVGYMFNNAMTGGVDNEITLSTYIAITLLEINLPVTHTVVRNALFCLESALEGNNNIYTKALMAYAFSLAGKWDIRSRILQSLDEKAVKHGNTVHWQRPEFSEEQLQNKRAPSLEVEMTSYVLLAELTKPELTDEDLTQATKKVYWILKQQNPNGGFSSTPDTVVALQALATYGYHAFKHDGPRDVAVSHGETPVAKLHVEDSNRLLLQQVPLPNIPGDYSVSVSGSGCVFMQSTLRYNIPHPEREAPFTITVTTLPSTCTAKSLHTFSISVNVSYTGNRENSNMAIVEVKLPSGYIPIKPSVRQLTSLPLIKRTESQPNKVIVYFEKLTSAPQVFKFNVEQEIAMSNLQAASAKIYDYYESDDYAVAEYSAPCSSRDDVHNE